MTARAGTSGDAGHTVGGSSYAARMELTQDRRAELAGRVPRLVGRLTSTSDEVVTTRSPLDGSELAAVPQSSVADVEAAAGRARLAQEAWAQTSYDDRAATLLRLHDLVLDRREEICDLITLESGKARLDAFQEVVHVAITARYYARTGARHLARSRRAGALPGLTGVEVNQVPKGVVGIISPWNYPFTMSLCDGLAALMAGNAVVAKPDAQTMLSALLGLELLEEAGLPPGLWNVVAGPGPVVGPALVRHVDHVCFTGSTETGRLVAGACAERLIGCSLELGGKNPFLVLVDADVDRAVDGAVRASFGNAGQLCVSTERTYVADNLYDRFVARFVERTGALRLGAGLGWDVEVGPLISQAQLDRVVAHVEDAVARGARVLTGGRARPDIAPYAFEPTILEGVTPAMTCFATETFGPVTSVYRFHDEADAIARANAGDYGLNAAVYGRHVGHARSVARRLRCGSVNVNEAYGATFGSLDAPMGGMRRSGLGRRQGPEGILRFTDPQTVAVQRLLPMAPTRRQSAEAWAGMIARNTRILRRLGHS